MRKFFIAAAVLMTALFTIGLLLMGFHIVSYIHAPNPVDVNAAFLMLWASAFAFGGMCVADERINALRGY